MGSLSLVLILLSHACAVSASDSRLHNDNIFILAGQSNMAGRGGVINGTWDGIVPSECQPNPSILRLTAGLTWVEAREPLHADIDTNKTCGIGPGMAFANAVLRDPAFGIVGLVPCAVGATNISEWSRGTYLYTQLVRRAKASLQHGGKIRALLWYQGESDSKSPEYAKSYKGGSSIRRTIYKDSERSSAGVDLPNVTCVDAMGLPLEPDGIHLTTPAQIYPNDPNHPIVLHDVSHINA
ncbi:putative carbohydrate esterase [Vitis vinifera]|uniref:Putative carbohydrate esterase n=1 Tax=Vitis vinifera TaxID=29760 RepID=A0A438DYC8_VITVI|nr:putative carbohydrate esterase [Vitis vinifera]